MADMLRLEELSAATVVAVNSLTLKPGQEQFIMPVSYAMAAAVVPQECAWQRVALLGERVVGFVHANFDPQAQQPHFQAALWRINVDADAQGTGVGKFLIEAVLAEAKRRNLPRLTVLWERGEAGPEDFFLRMGFQPVGETEYAEVIGAYELTSA